MTTDMKIGESVRAPKRYGEVPNVVVILLDDMGFGASSSFGGPVDMPVTDVLAANGLRYNQFHTTAVCSCTRAALLTGRNHHSVGVGMLIEAATAAPGYTGRIPREAAGMARILRDAGYATGAFGKMHETPRSEATPVGPYDRWPTQGHGFEKFYGFIGGGMSHWLPQIFDGTTLVEPAVGNPDYHLTEDIVRQVIHWIGDVRTFTPQRPFFCYLPFGATHTPFHVHRGWVEKYKGKFDHGWNAQRDQIIARQRELGIIPENTELAPWAPTIEQWDELTTEEQRAAAAIMEVYAGFAEHTDAQIGVFIDYLRESGMLENTLIFYILGDNGASAEGGRIGSATGYYSALNGAPETTEMVLQSLSRAGGPDTWPHYARGWALAMDTPFQWVKQVASHYGATRNGMIVHWPERLAACAGEIRNQWHHVIDIAPTILAAAGIPHPESVDGVLQRPIEGVDMGYSFTNEMAPDTRKTQYFELGGSRAIYHEGWVACTVHRPTPWNVLESNAPSFEEDVWELYDTGSDFSQAQDLSAIYPDKLVELKRIFLKEAEKYQVLPLDDRSMGARRSARETGDFLNELTLRPGSSRLPYDALPRMFNHSHTITCKITTDGSDTGVLCSLGGIFSGWSIYLVDGVLTYCHTLGEFERYIVRSDRRLEAGSHEVGMRFTYQGNGRLGGPAEAELTINDVVCGQGQLPRSLAFLVPQGEDFMLEADPETPVSHEYPAGDNAFTGVISWVRINSGDGTIPTLSEKEKVERALQ